MMRESTKTGNKHKTKITNVSNNPKQIHITVVSCFLVILTCFNATISLAEEATSNLTSQANVVNHNTNSANYFHEATTAVSSINPSIFNPNHEISSIITSLLHSSLNLSSTEDIINTGFLSHPVILNQINHNETLLSHELITPAQAIALSQILSDNKQTLAINQFGQAIGGSFDVSNLLTNNLFNHQESLLIPQNVTLIDNSKFNLNASLENYGDIVINNSFSAAAILNEPGGQIVSNTTALNLSSSTLINEGSIYGANGININSSLIYNSGTIDALAGNINITGSGIIDITGTQMSLIEANNINITNSSQASNSSINLTFNNYTTKELNLTDKNGDITGAVENVSGIIKSTATTEHLASQSSDMIIGPSNITGDPTYVNTSGNITIDGSVTTSGNSIAIIASGSINVASGVATSISTQGSVNTSGGSVFLLAGLGSNLSYSGSNRTTTVPGTAISSTETVTVNLGSQSGNAGGNIDLLTGNTLSDFGLVINTIADGLTSNGGNVTMVALNNGTNGGDITTGNATTQLSIETGGGPNGTNGNVLIIAGSPSSVGINLGTITTFTGGATNSGSISIYDGNPTQSQVVFNSSGTIKSGSISPDLNSLLSGSIEIYGEVISPTNTVIETNGSIVVNSSILPNSITPTSTSTLAMFAGGNIYFPNPAAAIEAGSIYLTTNNGNIGSSSDPANINTNNLNISYTGNAYISDQISAINLATIDAVNTLNVICTSNITTSGTISANTIVLTTQNNGGITANSSLGTASTTSQTLTTSGNGYILTGTNGVIIGKSLNLSSPNGEIGFNGNGLITQANNITFNAGLSVGINNTSSNLNLAASTSSANVYVINTGNITASGTLTAPVLGLYSTSGTAGIGTASNLIQIMAHNIGLSSFSSSGSVYVNDAYSGNTVLQASQAGDVFKLNTNGGLTIYAQIEKNGQFSNGAISAQIMAIQTFGGFGIYNGASLQSNDFIFLTASQSGVIEEPNTSTMTAPNIALVSGGGSIGNGGSIYLNSAKVAASTQGSGTYVNIVDSSLNSGIIGGQAGNYFNFTSAGNLNIFGSIATGAGTGANGGNINITANGTINVGTSSPVIVSANNGSIVFQDNNSTAGSINLSNGSSVNTAANTATSGYIVFNIGSYNQTNTTNPDPANIQVLTSGGAQVYFGNNGIKASSGGNVLYADNQAIVLNTNNLPASAITLNGNVHITADPKILLNSGVNPNFNNPFNLNNNLFNQSINSLYSHNNNNNNSRSVNISYKQDFAKKANNMSLLIATEDLKIDLKPYNSLIQIKKGSIVLLTNDSNIQSVYCLHDNSDNSVLVKFTDRSISLKPGQHISLVKSVNCSDFSLVNLVSNCGYRNIQERNIAPNLKIFISEFSIPSLILSAKPLHDLFTSKSKDKYATSIKSKILKTASIIYQNSYYKGLYIQMNKMNTASIF